MNDASMKFYPLLDIPPYLSRKEGRTYNIFLDYRKIGSCSCLLIDGQAVPKGEEHFFPKSWFMEHSSKNMKAILQINGLETFSAHTKGNGRLCLQALYFLSKARGCDGRLQVFSAFGSGSFYEHCGFRGKVGEKDGIKYFDPTPENLHSLFLGKISDASFKFIPVNLPRKKEKSKESDDDLMFEMLKKSQHSK